MVEAIFVNGKEKKEEIISIIKSSANFQGNIIFEKKNISFDESTYNVIVYEDQVPVAFGSLTTISECSIDYAFVLEDYRKKYLGDLVIKMLLDKGFNLGFSEVITYSPIELIGFFKKIGFYEIESIDHTTVKLGIQKNNLRKCKH